jgi:putative transcriptional regulator
LNCFLMTIKNRLRKIRHELKIDKQIDMARLLGLRQEQYNIYELQRSQPSLEIALRIAKKLNRPVEEIFWLEDD